MNAAAVAISRQWPAGEGNPRPGVAGRAISRCRAQACCVEDGFPAQVMTLISRTAAKPAAPEAVDHATRLRVGRTGWNARLGAGFRLFRPPATCSTAGNAGNGKRNASPTTRIRRTRRRREWRSSHDDHEVDPAVRPSPGQTSGHVNARIRGGSMEAPPPAAMRQTAAEQLLPRRARSVPPHESRLLATPKAALRSCWRIFRRSTQDASRRRIHRLPRVAGGGASWRAREDSNPQPPDP